jgi:outer membrane protein assembly factor BamB
MNFPSAPSPAPARRRFPWIPIVIVLLGAAAIVQARLRPEMERNFQLFETMIVSLLVPLLVLIWFLLSSRFRARTRLVVLAIVIVTGFGFKLATRVDGTVNGTGLPRFVWKWSAPTVPRLERPPVAATAAGGGTAQDEERLAQAANVPQFFGPHRDGVITGAHLEPDWKIDPPKEVWRQPIGAGWSAFAVVQGRAYTQEQRGDDEMVICYDLFSGKVLWEHADKTTFTQWQSGTGPHATPTFDRGRVYTYGGAGLLNCLDALTGQVVWRRSVLTDNNLPNLTWGTSASPLLVEDKVIVTGGDAMGPTLLAYQRDTGAPLWKSGSDKVSYASPIVAMLAGKRVILSNNARGFSASDPSTGSVLLDCAWGDDKWPKASQPVVIGLDEVFVSGGYGFGCHLFQVSADPSGHLTAAERWRSLRMKTQFNSVAVRDGHAYGLDDGRLACVDLATGERLWKDGNFGSGQTLLVDDLIIVQSESGAVYLTAAKPDGYHELGKIDALHSKTWNHPTLAGRFLLVRNDREAVCYELPVSTWSQ